MIEVIRSRVIPAGAVQKPSHKGLDHSSIEAAGANRPIPTITPNLYDITTTNRGTVSIHPLIHRGFSSTTTQRADFLQRIGQGQKRRGTLEGITHEVRSQAKTRNPEPGFRTEAFVNLLHLLLGQELRFIDEQVIC